MPEGESPLRLTRTFSGLDPGGRILELAYVEAGVAIVSEVWIDANTGKIVNERVREQDRPLLQKVLDTIVVEEFDASTAPWPYSEAMPLSLKRNNNGSVSYVTPPPAAGVQTIGGIGDPGGPFIGITNGRSSLTFPTRRPIGEPLAVDYSLVLPEDRAAFERWISHVELCGADIQC